MQIMTVERGGRTIVGRPRSWRLLRRAIRRVLRALHEARVHAARRIINDNRHLIADATWEGNAHDPAPRRRELDRRHAGTGLDPDHQR